MHPHGGRAGTEIICRRVKSCRCFDTLSAVARLARDGLSVDASIINRNKTSTDEEAKTRERAEEEVAKIVTQVYDYMIDKGVTYGYAMGGEVFVFLYYTPHDVQTLHYHSVMPRDAVSHHNDLSQSAIGLVASFACLARDGPVFDAEWSKATRKKLPALDCG